eukprot:Platyproteum_vivax@DN2496_c0_g1_i1.p1
MTSLKTLDSDQITGAVNLNNVKDSLRKLKALEKKGPYDYPGNWLLQSMMANLHWQAYVNEGKNQVHIVEGLDHCSKGKKLCTSDSDKAQIICVESQFLFVTDRWKECAEACDFMLTWWASTENDPAAASSEEKHPQLHDMAFSSAKAKNDVLDAAFLCNFYVGTEENSSGNYAQALLRFDKCVEIKSKCEKLDAMLASRLEFARANTLYELKRYDEALKCIHRTKIRSFVQFHQLHGQILEALGDYKSATLVYADGIKKGVPNESLQQLFVKANQKSKVFPNPVVKSDNNKKFEFNSCWFCQKHDVSLRCSACLRAYYCSKEHKKQDFKRHKKVCSKLKEKCEDEEFIFSSKQTSIYTKIIVAQEISDLSKLDSWSSFDKFFVLPLDKPFERQLKMFLSFSLTVIHALCKHKLDKKEGVKVHIIGSEDYDVFSFSFPCVVDLFRVLPIPNMQIIFVGPELTPKSEISVTTKFGKNISMIIESALWHEASLDSPDLVVGFHPGFGITPPYEGWESTLELLIKKQLPMYFTCFNHDDLQRDLTYLHKTFGVMADVSSENPLPSLWVEPSIESGSKILNQYYYTLYTK